MARVVIVAAKGQTAADAPAAPVAGTSGGPRTHAHVDLRDAAAAATALALRPWGATRPRITPHALGGRPALPPTGAGRARPFLAMHTRVARIAIPPRAPILARTMSLLERLRRLLARLVEPNALAKAGALIAAFGVAGFLSVRLHGGGLWQGLAPAIAAGSPSADHQPAPYDLTQLRVVNEVLKTIRDRYVDPRRVKSKDMLLSALDYVQKDVAQVIVVRDETNPSKVRVRVDTQEKEFRVDDVIGPWDVSSHLRDVFAFVQDGLRGTDVDLRDVEYAASNGISTRSTRTRCCSRPRRTRR